MVLVPFRKPAFAQMSNSDQHAKNAVWEIGLISKSRAKVRKLLESTDILQGMKWVRAETPAFQTRMRSWVEQRWVRLPGAMHPILDGAAHTSQVGIPNGGILCRRLT
jgi:hypothetical protein